MPLQPLLPVLMNRMALPNLTQTVPHQKLIIPCCEDRRRHIDQDGNPAVIIVRERLAAEEDGRDDAGAEVTRQIRRDGDVGEGPDHGGVGHADGEGRGGGGDEGVGRVEARPDDEADVGVDEELGEEEVAQVGLRGEGEGAEEVGGRGEADERFARCQRLRFEGCDLRPVHSYHQQAGHEGAEDLGEDVVWDFFPGEALPDGEANLEGELVDDGCGGYCDLGGGFIRSRRD